MTKRAAVVGSLLSLAAILAACGDDDGSESADSNVDACTDSDVSLEDVVAIEGDEVAVRAQDNVFDEQNIQIAVGTTVTWENAGRQDHTVTPADEACDDWGVGIADFTPGDTYQHTFDEPGTYRYYCEPHGTPDAGMIGAVVVE